MSLRLRRFTRFPLESKARLSWDSPQGETIVCVGQVMDVSLEGMQVTSPYAIPLRTILRFHFQVNGFEGSASVRSCVLSGVRYRIGVEFCGGLKFKAPPELHELVARQNQ